MMIRYRRLLKLEPDADRLRAEFTAGERTYGRLFALLERQYADRMGKPRWGDKSLNTERYAGPIFSAYPSARILHMIRDPRDRYASSQTRWKLRRGGIGAGTAEWLASARLAMRNQHQFPNTYRVIRYETLAQAPEQTLRDICAFIGEPWVPEMLSMEGAPRFLEQGSNSSYGRREPGVISTQSIGRFRTVLSRDQIAFMQRHAHDEMAHFGYDQDAIRFSMAQRSRYAMAVVPLEVSRLLAWRGREAVRNRAGRPVPSYRLIDGASPT
jgi:hypothetical protein